MRGAGASEGLSGRRHALMALADAVQPRQTGREVVDERQFAVRVAYRQQAPDRVTADDDPVHVAARAMHADVVQRGEGLSAGEVDGPQVEDELSGNTGDLLDVAAEVPAVGGIDIANHRDRQSA